MLYLDKVKQFLTLYFCEFTILQRTLSFVSRFLVLTLSRGCGIVWLQGAASSPENIEFQVPVCRACEETIGGLIMYYYILGCGIACLVLVGIISMESVCVKPAEILAKVVLWPVALMEAVVRYSSTHHNFKAAL